ncbi:MAG: hypothetical protein KBE65_02605 [Phycisphaerae bacterium]|nr:hypothetical protein [Phycisphaerae bacterium]
MKAAISSVLLVAILSVSPVTLGEIVYDESSAYEGNSWGTTGSAFANGSNPEDAMVGCGYQSYYTTVAGYFDWSYVIYARTFSQLILFNGDLCEADAWGLCVASIAGDSTYRNASTSLSESGYNGQQYLDDDPEPNEPAGLAVACTDAYVEASEGISTAHYASASASAVSQSASTAYATVETTAYCSMY